MHKTRKFMTPTTRELNFLSYFVVDCCCCCCVWTEGDSGWSLKDALTSSKNAKLLVCLGIKPNCMIFFMAVELKPKVNNADCSFHITFRNFIECHRKFCVCREILWALDTVHWNAIRHYELRFLCYIQSTFERTS